MRIWWTIVLLSAASAGCSKQPQEGNAATNKTPSLAVAETIKTEQGATYTVTRLPGIKLADLPITNDFKMADMDLAKYAKSLCALDTPGNAAIVRCDLYVQPDKSGTLIGYTAVTQDANGASFQTTAQLNQNDQAQNKECGFMGELYEGSERVKDVKKDFHANFTFSATEKEPGDWLISQQKPEDATDDDPSAQIGQIFLSKEGNKMEISQENWNFCYPDGSKVRMDDVFYEAASLAKSHP